MTSTLSDREVSICLRLKEAREHLGLSQDEFAKRGGITRGGLGNYELCRTPLRCDLALRICRSFIISEEWLATGRFAALAAVAQPFKLDSASGRDKFKPIFIRQCMDLISEPLSMQVPRSMLFSAAYDKILAPLYTELARACFPGIRLRSFRAHDAESTLNLFDVYLKRWLYLIGGEAARYKREPEQAQEYLLNKMLLFGEVLFNATMGWERPEIHGPTYDFLRLLSQDATSRIGPLQPSL